MMRPDLLCMGLYELAIPIISGLFLSILLWFHWKSWYIMVIGIIQNDTSSAGWNTRILQEFARLAYLILVFQPLRAGETNPTNPTCQYPFPSSNTWNYSDRHWYHCFPVPVSRSLHEYDSGWCFGTCFIFPDIGNNHPNWFIFSRGVETTNQPLTYSLTIDI